MIIDKEKLIFVHIPKNAGSTIKNLFFKKDELETPFKHKTIQEIKKENLKEYKDYRKFTVVRNPYDRLVSWYAYNRRYRVDKNLKDYNDWINTYQYNSKTDSYEIIETIKAPIDEFKEWAEHQLCDDTITSWGCVKATIRRLQLDWIDDSVVVLRYENLKEDLENFLGKEVELPVVNNTSRFEFIDYYNEELLDITYNYFKKDFEKFNYEKL